MGGTNQFEKIQIVQWNARSLRSDGRSKLPELYHFLESFENKPEIVCLQETWITKKHNQLKLKGYSPPAIFRRERDQQGGGVAIFVKSGIDHKILKIPDSKLKTVGMRIFGDRKNIDIINIYAPQTAEITENELNKITNNLENNVVILGDFNSHNRLWEPHCNNDDKKSEEILKFMTRKNLMLLNKWRIH